MRINVYDAKNPERLLGSISKPTARSPIVHLPIYEVRLSQLYSYRMDEPITTDFDRIVLESHVRYSNGGWDVEVAAKTSTSLRVLLKHPDFRLPGETDRQADARRLFS